MSQSVTDDVSRTQRKRLEQFSDRWSSYGGQSGLDAVSDKPSAEQLRQVDIFADFDDRFLERISPDVAFASWRQGSVLFEQGAYLDLAFFIIAGEVEIFFEGGAGWQPTQETPIFDAERTSNIPIADIASQIETQQASGEHTSMLSRAAVLEARASGNSDDNSTTDERRIAFLATFDFDLEPGRGIRLGAGEIFGEIGAMSGWPQSAAARTATDCQLVQIRVPALRAMKRKSTVLKQRMDRLYRQRALHRQLRFTPLFQGLPESDVHRIEESIELVSLEPGEVLAQEGQPADAVYLVRSGFLRLAQGYGQGELVATYLSKGMTFGDIEAVVEGIDGYEMSATSVEYAELVKIPLVALHRVFRDRPEARERVWQSAMARLKELGATRRDPGRSAFVETALDRGLVQGNSILVIDLETCTRCDDCVRACAATHEGRPRFVREGERIENLMIARSCYHCRDPVCLVGCPTGAIHRAGVGDVVDVDDPICIGCGTCANNCPYDAIVMHDTGDTWPDDMLPAALRGEQRKVASKCDLCSSRGHEPACVENCPQGCAFRVGSVDEFRSLLDT